MWQDLVSYLRGRKILIWGFGAEGQSSARFLHRHLPAQLIQVTDERPANIANGVQGVGAVEIWPQAEALARLTEFDLILKSPGISLLPFDFKPSERAKIRGQADLFLQFAPGHIIGITGTKGKSTTASLLAHLLSDAPQQVPLAGNIGLPAWEIIESLGPRTRCVLELSSYQLESAACSPSVAVLLNLYQEHLNYHGTLAAYWQAKWNIARQLKASQVLVYNASCEATRPLLRALPSEVKRLPFGGDSLLWQSEMQSHPFLRGEHNWRNVQAAMIVAQHLKVDEAKLRERLQTFRGLPHRLENIGTFGGVTYYNDSISTVPESALAALAALPETKTIILGGQDRGVAYSELAEALKKFSGLENILLISETGAILRDLLVPDARVHWFKTLDEAIAVAQRRTPAHGVCLFSPAAPSYNQFKNFEARGRAFQELVSKKVSL